MKILLSTRRFTPPFMGGVDVYADRLGRALKRLGHEVAFLAFNTTETGEDPSISLVQELVQESPVWRFKFAVPARPKEAFARGYDPEVGAMVRQILVDYRPDLFLVLNFYLLTFSAVEAAAALSIPVAHIATDFIPVCRRATLIRWNGEACETGESVTACASCFVSQHPLGRLAAGALDLLPEGAITALAASKSSINPLRLVEPYRKQAALMRERITLLAPLRRQLELVLAPTRYTAAAFVANGFAPEQVHLLPFAVEPDHPLASVRHSAADHVRFLFVGRLQPYKGAHVLLEAFNSLASPRNASLTIYGGASGYESYYEELKRLAAGNDRVRFAGTVAPEELGQAFMHADYFVLPSIWPENSPLILLDALQSRTPVIASDMGGAKDVVQHGVNGWLFPMGDVDALRRVLQDAIDQPGLVETLRAGIELPTIDAYAVRLLELLRKNVSGDSPA